MPLSVTGYTGRAVQGQHADPWFDVTAYGFVDKTGAASSNAAFAAAVAAVIAAPRGGVLFIPAGIYLINTGTIDFTSSSNPIAIIGVDRALSLLLPASGTGDVVKMSATADGASIQNLGFWSNTPQTAGSAINTNGCDDMLISNVLFNNQFQDVYINNTSIKVQITHTVHTQANGSSTSVGILVTNGAAGDTYIGPDVVMSNTGTTRRAASVQVTQSGHFEINQANLTGSVQGLLVNPGAGVVVADGFINYSLFDSCTVNGVTLNSTGAGSVIKSVMFNNSWFAGTITGTGGAGLVTTGGSGGVIDSVSFQQCRYLNNQTHGMQFGYGTDVRLFNCEIRGNSQATSNTYDGVNIAANVSNWTITGGKSGGTDSNSTGGNQRYGVNILAGSSNDFAVIGMDLIGNNTGPYFDGSTGLRKSFRDNIGAPLPVTPSVAASAAINTTETVIPSAQIAIPAGSLQVGSTYRFTVYGQCTTTVANLSTFTVRFGTAGTTADTSVGTFTSTAASTGTSIPFIATSYFTVRTTGATGSAVSVGSIANSGVTGIATQPNTLAPSGSAVTATTINTTASSFLSLTYKSAASSTTSTFHVSITEIIKP